MWSKLLQLVLSNVILPLVEKGFNWLWKYWQGKAEDSDRNDLIDEGAKKIKEAKTDEERKKALDEFMRGIGSLRP